jgi:RimJ/RimL family protein N-acetyltransferase
MAIERAPLELTTPRLRLRQFVAADHEAYAAMSADAEVMRYIGGGGPVSSDDAWRGIAGMLGHWALRGYGMWALQLRGGGGPMIGRAGFIDPPGWPGFEIGWLLAREHWGHGYAREAVQAVLAVAFGPLRRESAISLIRPGNARSIRLAERLGATLDGRIDFMGGETLLYRHRASK